MRRSWSWAARTGAALVAGLGAFCARAATILDRNVDAAIAGGEVTLHERIEVVMEEPGDLEIWKTYPIYLDLRVKLVASRAEVRAAGGAVLRSISERENQRLDAPGSDLYSSRWASLIPLGTLAVGQHVVLDVTTRHTPYYPSIEIVLAEYAPQKRLSINVHGGGLALRSRCVGAPEGTEISRSDGGVTLAARDVPGYPNVALAPDAASASMLGLAWAEGEKWADVGRWYEDIVADATVPTATITALARKLLPMGGSPRDKVLALTRYVKGAIRYEAVEIGAGGWIPGRPADVVARGWGDCKDKSALLVSLLRVANIPAFLVLANGGPRARVDPTFPTADSFNHCIVAMPASAAGAEPDDPVVDDLLLVDATSQDEGIAWLTPFCQGDRALVVDGGKSKLIDVPDRHSQEVRDLAITGSIDATGLLIAKISLTLSGSQASVWLADVAHRPSEIDDGIRALVEGILPGADVTATAHEAPGRSLPTMRLEAELSLEDALRGEPPDWFLQLRALTALPESRLLDHRTVPVVLQVGISHTTWTLGLPKGCTPIPQSLRIANDVGLVAVEVSPSKDGLLVERTTEIRRSWIDPGDLPDLAALCVAESRAERARVVLRCDAP